MIPLQPDEKAAVQALIAVVEQYVMEQGRPGQRWESIVLPEGLRLEIHPLVNYMLLRNLDPEFIPLGGDPLKRIPIPVRINTELPRYAWRLVIITEDVINGGVMPHKEDPCLSSSSIIPTWSAIPRPTP